MKGALVDGLNVDYVFLYENQHVKDASHFAPVARKSTFIAHLRGLHAWVNLGVEEKGVECGGRRGCCKGGALGCRLIFQFLS